MLTLTRTHELNSCVGLYVLKKPADVHMCECSCEGTKWSLSCSTNQLFFTVTSPSISFLLFMQFLFFITLTFVSIVTGYTYLYAVHSNYSVKKSFTRNNLWLNNISYSPLWSERLKSILKCMSGDNY